MNRRQHLGTVYTSYPAKDLGESLGGGLFKFIMAIISCIIWTGVFYVLAGVVTFVRGNVSGEVAENTSTMTVFSDRIGLSIYILGCIVTAVLVFRSRIGEKSSMYKKDTRGEQFEESLRRK